MNLLIHQYHIIYDQMNSKSYYNKPIHSFGNKILSHHSFSRIYIIHHTTILIGRNWWKNRHWMKEDVTLFLYCKQIFKKN